VAVSVWMPDSFASLGVEITDLSGETRLFGRSRWVVVFFLIGGVDIDFFFLKWDEIEGELCLPRVGRALMVLCFP
jgi:hypothetical protein